MTKEEAVYVLNLLKRQDLKINSAATEAIDMAISALEKQEQDRWIPVTERMPKNKKKVLVSYDTEDGKKVDISMFDKYGCLLGLVSAWRPLPEPYTEGEA